MEIRLQKFLADNGLNSRRKSEELILKGYISVNNEVITQLGFKVDPLKDIVKFKGKIIKLIETKVYIMLNKPEGYVTTIEDQFNRPTVIDIINNIDVRIFPVGRLDYHTSGLLLLTNDGSLAYKLTHPKNKIKKIYIAKLKGRPSKESLYKLRNGIDIGGYITSKAGISIVEELSKYTILKITISEGKNRQIRRMCEAIGHEVLNLKRVSIANINLGNLKYGAYRSLTETEIAYLKNM